MHTRQITMLMTVVSLLALGQALAQPPTIPNFQRGQVLTADELNRMVGQINKNTSALDAGDGETHMVDCGSGETIAAAMSQAQPGDTIMIAAGTCNENVVVNKDGITLVGDGQDSTVIDGGDADAAAIAVIGHQNVTIKGLTARNGLNGIYVTLGAAAWLENVTAQGSRAKSGHGSGNGIIVSESSNVVMVGGVVASNNAANGVLVWHGSSVSVIGNFGFQGRILPPASLRANSNGSSGIQVGSSSALQVSSLDAEYTTVLATANTRGISLAMSSSAFFGGGAHVVASDNTEAGLWIEMGSSAQFNGWTENSRGYTGEFNHNGQFGIAVLNQGSLHTWDSGIASSITATNNVTDGTGLGLIVEAGSTAFFNTLSAQTSSKLVLDSNGHGAGVYGNSSLHIRLPTEIKDNVMDGIYAWGNAWVDSGTVTGSETMITGNGRNGISAWNGVGIWLRNATITGNTETNIAAGQGSRLDWSDSQVDDPIYCDPTALAVPFSEASCPGSSDQ